MKKKKVAVLVSGGVDSSVVLALLAKNPHYDLHAFYLKIWLEEELRFLGNCPWQEDLGFVEEICQKFSVPLQVVPLQQAYQERVVSYTISELKAGRTPSPDIFCNQRVKFGAFLDHVGASFDFVATGHYAIVQQSGEDCVLQRGVDPVKDQSYFLSHLSKEQLRRCLFPLGVYEKSKVRQMAVDFDLPNKDRPDSQGICFLGKIPYNEFIEYHLGEKIGRIIEHSSGKVLGQHKGYWFHTLGQRKGLGLGGGPWFVSKKDIDSNTVFVTHDSQMDSWQPNQFDLIRANWLTDKFEGGHYHLKVRHGPHLHQANIASTGTSGWRVHLNSYDRGLSPGQFAVVYEGDRCLGGGMIESPRCVN